MKTRNFQLKGAVAGLLVAGLCLATGITSRAATIVFHVRDSSLRRLDVNNISALFSASGLNFLQFGEEATEIPGFEAPKGSGKGSIFAQSLWVGGFAGDGQQNLAGERYRSGPTSSNSGTKPDFRAGPVSSPAGYNESADTAWNYIWKVTRTEIDYHRNHFWETGYRAPHDLLTWPGNGDPSLGQAPRLAPFSDRNGNGLYEPYDGDYPEIRGDQALYFIYNDDRGAHLETWGRKLRIEVHAMAYGFDRPGDTAFKNTVFVHYKVFNRSQETYTATRFGIFTDFDLGMFNDDYIGCDVERGMFYAYNGQPVDGTGQPYAYGPNPPMQAVVILAGPAMDPDGYDNPSYRGSGLAGPSFHGSCDIVTLDNTLATLSWGPGGVNQGSFPVRAAAVNGFGFGDGIADNERLGLTQFFYPTATENPTYGLPYPGYAYEYYYVMDCRWLDSLKMTYGGQGRPLTGGYGPECNFMYPGLTDRCNLGTGGTLPDGPKEWTERTALNYPQDRWGAGTSGAFTFQPGGAQELDIAFVWARDYDASDSTLAKLNAAVDTIRSRFEANTLPGGGIIYGMDEPVATATLAVFPNPAQDRATIRLQGGTASPGEVSILSVTGTEMYRGSFPGVSRVVAVDGFPAGLYVVRVITGKGVHTARLVVRR